jgi:predicted RNase H-like HicB family nuclease
LLEEPTQLADPALRIRVFPDGDQYTALLDPLSIGSCGDTPEAARESLLEAISEFKEFLEESEATLGPELGEQLRLLRGYSQ